MECNEKELNITMPRGDVRQERFGVYEDEKCTILADIEFHDIYFTVKRNFSDTKYLFQKRLSNETINKGEDGLYHFAIEAEDTNNLPFGEYVFDIEVYRDNAHNPDIKQTFTGRLLLTNESTHQRNEV